jgi:hypothetical protein
MASDSELWLTQSTAVDELLGRGLLPEFRRSPVNGRVDLVYHAGARLPEGLQTGLVERLEEFNAAFGAERQGDLRLVFVGDASARQQPEAYTSALKAYWSNPEAQGADHLLPKNNLTLVFFTSNPTISGTARAFTGMPLGNESLLAAINEQGVLDNLSTQPDLLFGRVKAVLTEGGDGGKLLRYEWQDGVLSRLLWGKDNPDQAFVRVSMSENFAGFWKMVKPTPEDLINPGVNSVGITGLIGLGICFFTVSIASLNWQGFWARDKGKITPEIEARWQEKEQARNQQKSRKSPE